MVKISWERLDIGQDNDENILTKMICSWFETDQSQNVFVLCMLWVLPSLLNPRVSLVNRLGLHLGCRSVLAPLGLR